MLSVNFLKSDHDTQARRKTVVLAAVFALCVALIATAGAAASYRSVQHGTSLISEFEQLPVIADMRRMVFGEDAVAAGLSTSKNDQYLNVLILGIGGAGHDGSLLTDTIILASVDMKEKKVGMLSIPRDLAYPIGNNQYEKINVVHAYEEQDHPGEGSIRTAEKLSAFLDVPIDHVIRIDFRGFEALVDTIGGIKVNVENSFTDSSYPAGDNEWQVVSFKKGLQQIDGARALKYTRSRHGNNGEGSDFARSRRQQLVIEAIRDKLISLNTLADPGKLAKLYSTITNNIQSDMSPWDVIRLAPLAEQFSSKNITNHVLTTGNNGQLNSALINGAYMLFPKNNDWSTIKSLAQNPFQSSADVKAEVAAATQPMAHVELRNGTFRTGLASLVSDKLEFSGFETVKLGNAVRRGYADSIIFDLTNGAKPEELAKLKALLKANVSLSVATLQDDGAKIVYGEEMSVEKVTSDIDFLVILGETSYSFATTAYVH